MANYLYINNQEIETFGNNFGGYKTVSFLVKKEFIHHFKSVDIGGLIYYTNNQNFKKISFEEIRIFESVSRFESFIEIKFLNTKVSDLDKSDFREFQLEKLLFD